MITRKHKHLLHQIIPERYRLMLHPDLERFTFRGEETAYIRLRKPMRVITFHAKDIKVLKAEFRQGRKAWKPRRIYYIPADEHANFEFGESLPKGKGELYLEFSGVLNDQMRGFYRSRYEVNGKTHYMATTQFEATDARRAFPCIDEPAAKAIFDVTLIIPKGQRAISNTHETSAREHSSGFEIVEFAPTPKMSTYLLAFIVGRFEYVERKTKEGVLVRVFVTPGKKKQAMFALDVAVRSMSFFHKYFGVPYPMPVLDMIAIPDFSAGAMENWGAVTYRESMILFDDKHSSLANKQWVALVIAHELAHQWFGNLVTMEWWTHLWLNEGFASWIEYLAIDHLFPKWDIWMQFVAQDWAEAMHLDALGETHPIEVEVTHPDEIGEIFDAVSYSKGASLIRMLAEYLGERDFRNGLRHYLKKHQYANATTDDLWAAFEHIAKKPVRVMACGWTKQAGYPLVTVQESGKQLVLRQSRFCSSSVTAARFKNDKTRWSIPVGIQKVGKKRPSYVLLQDRQTSFKRSLFGRQFKLNSGAIGIYRVDYPVTLLRALSPLIGQQKLSVPDRLSLENDAFSLAKAGRVPTVAALALAENYLSETDYNIWLDLAGHLGAIENLISGETFEGAYKNFARSLFAPLARSMGWKSRRRESHTATLLRSLALFQAGHYGDRVIIETAQKLFRDVIIKKKHLDPNLRGVVYSLVAKSGGLREYRILRRLYQRATLHEEKNRIGRAIGFFRETGLIKETLRFAVSDHVRKQDMSGVLAAIWSNPKGRELAWSFIRKNWLMMLKRYGHGGHILPRIIEPAAQFQTIEKAREVERFFKTHKAPGAERTIRQILERIYSNAAWFERDSAHIAQWLEVRQNKNK